jgi:DHA1 family multidrug resistance protein-like MFS transporter
MEPTETEERREGISRINTASTISSSTSSSSGESIEREEIGVSRIATQPDLERHPTALSRIATGRSIHSATVGTSMRSRTATRHSRTPLPAFGAGKDYPPLLPDREEYVVEFDGPNDPLHAQNWPLAKKLPVCITLAYVTLAASFGSSIFSAALGQVASEFDLSTEVSVLGVSLYVLGFAAGKH